ncbi:MAG: diguanylate cyclase [Oleispira sp.]|nr:diguanylate cyclase [Oleispira sp.]
MRKIIKTQGVILLTACARIGLLVVLILASISISFAHTTTVNRLGTTFDFASWQVDDGAVILNGAWGIHWQQQLSPQKWPSKELHTIDMPTTWDKPVGTEPMHSGTGFATFTATLTNLPADVRWGMIIPEQSTSFRLYVNDNVVAEGGIAGLSKDSSEPYSGNQIIELGSLPANTKLTWHVSNFYHASGGPWQVLTIGSYSELRDHYFLQSFDQALVVTLALIISLFLLIQYFIDRRDKASLVLSAFASFIAVRVGITDNQTLYQMLGTLDWQLHIRLLYLTMLIAPPLVLLWQHYIFPAEISRRSIRYVSYAFVFPVLSIFILPTSVFTQFLMVFQVLLMAVIIVYSGSLFKVLVRKRQGGLSLVLGAALLIITILHDMALYSQWLANGRLWITYGLLGFLFSLAVNMLYLRSKQKQQVEDLSKQLLVANKLLEARVAQRTVELAEKADALEEANDKLQILANIDGLTGVLNRRAFVEQLEMLSRIKPAVALLMIDVDHFKMINDNYGHGVGDQVLKRLSDVFLEMKRDHDRIGRFGGEEFMVLLQDISAKGLDSYCRRLVDVVRQIDFSDIAPLDGVTISVGTTMAVLSTRNIDELIQQADEAMYQVKNSGRDGFKHYIK